MTTQPPPLALEPSEGTVPAQPQRRSPWLLAFSLALAAVLLYFTLRGLDWAAFWTTVRNGRYVFVLLVVPIASANYFIRAVRWSIFVRWQAKAPLTSVFWANMVGYLGNSYLPARAGEVLRSAYLGQQTGLGTSFILATALTERLMDVVALVVIGSVSLLMQTGLSAALASALRAVALAGFVGLAVVILAPFQERLILSIAAWLPLPERLSRGLSEQASRFLLGMRSLQNARRLFFFILFTLVIWLVDAFANMVGVRVISQSLTIPRALVLLAALGLSSAVPSTPGYVGVYQFVAVLVLVPFGFSRAEALAYILMSQILNYLIVSFWGLIGLWQVNRATASRAARDAATRGWSKEL